MNQSKPVTDLTRLFDAGAHFGQLKSRRHPSMKPFIVGRTARVELVDLTKTRVQLDEAKRVMEVLAKEGKTVLMVGGKQEIADVVRSTARALGIPYVASRWLGGTISNFIEIKKRIDRLADLRAKKESGEFAKLYTKLEQLYLDREADRLHERLEGITTLTKRPDAFVVVDTRRESHAVKEARAAGIPIIGIMSTDCNVADATYPIVVNDASRQAVTLVLQELADAYATGRRA